MKESVLLALFAFRHYGYPHLPEAMWGDAYAVGASVCIIALVVMLRVWWPLAAWIVGEEFLTAACSLWWLADPWIVEGAEQCSSRLGFKVGAIGLVALAMLGRRMSTVNSYSISNVDKGMK